MLRLGLEDRPEFLAGDDTKLRELLHPAKHDLKLGYSLAHGTLGPHQRSKWHRLSSSEVYYFIAGSGEFLIDNDSSPITAGSVVYVPPGAKQSVVNTGSEDLQFLCLVDPAWRTEDEDVLE